MFFHLRFIYFIFMLFVIKAQVINPERKVALEVPSEEERTDWMNAIVSAVAANSKHSNRHAIQTGTLFSAAITNDVRLSSPHLPLNLRS
jgi:hypothetical protein